MLLRPSSTTGTSLSIPSSDIAELAIFEGALLQVCSEMDDALERAAFSPIVSEARDRASGIYEFGTGDVVSQGRTGLPIFIGSMQYSVASLAAEVNDVRPGDTFVMNDPYRGGSHLMDVRLITPHFAGGEPLCFLANTAHWADIGGAVAGGFGAHTTSIHGEGIRIGPTTIMRDGKIIDDVKNLILENVRIPYEREGDLVAQLSALEIGRQRLDRVIAKYGLTRFRAYVDELASYSERMMRTRLDTIPYGQYRSETFLDDDGIGSEPLKIECAIDIEPGRVRVDFDGSSATCLGPLNAPVSATKAGVLIAFMHLFPDLPINHGSFRAIQISVPEGTFLHAAYPAPVAAGASEVPARVIDAVLLALGSARADLCQGEAFSTSSNLTLHGVENGNEYVMYFFAGGGYGGHAGGDGLSNACQPLSMAKTSPIEVFEERYPVRFERYQLRSGSCGLGQFRGGLGVEYELTIDGTEAELSFLMDRGKYPPSGVLGGGDASMTEVAVTRASGERIHPPHVSKGANILLRRGDRVRVATPGGGGFGPPQHREKSMVEKDLRAGYC
jgi:N-methylhydantoinase B